MKKIGTYFSKAIALMNFSIIKHTADQMKKNVMETLCSLFLVAIIPIVKSSCRYVGTHSFIIISISFFNKRSFFLRFVILIEL